MNHPHIVIQPVKSSNIAGLGYHAASKTLEVHFASGGKFRYADVPQAEFDALLKSPSVGSAFATRIRGKYTGTNLNPKPQAT